MEPATIARGMSTATARIAYDGEALRSGAMDVRDLAPALLEIGGLCERAGQILNGDDAKVSVQVKSDFKSGSFEVTFEILQTLGKQLRTFVFGQGVQDAKYIMELVGISRGMAAGAAVSAIYLYKKLRGRRPKNVTRLENGNVSINIENINVEISQETFVLYSDDAMRSRIEGTLRPLLRDGIDTFEVRGDDEIAEIVTKEEAREAYEARREEPDTGEPPIIDSTYEMALEVVKIPFKDKLTWNFGIGSRRISADMRDQVFLERHRDGLTSFSVGDVLRVRLHSKVWTTPSGLKESNEILQVLAHSHRPSQRSLPQSQEQKPAQPG